MAHILLFRCHLHILQCVTLHFCFLIKLDIGESGKWKFLKFADLFAVSISFTVHDHLQFLTTRRCTRKFLKITKNHKRETFFFAIFVINPFLLLSLIFVVSVFCANSFAEEVSSSCFFACWKSRRHFSLCFARNEIPGERVRHEGRERNLWKRVKFYLKRAFYVATLEVYAFKESRSRRTGEEVWGKGWPGVWRLKGMLKNGEHYQLFDVIQRRVRTWELLVIKQMIFPSVYLNLMWKASLFYYIAVVFIISSLVLNPEIYFNSAWNAWKFSISHFTTSTSFSPRKTFRSQKNLKRHTAVILCCPSNLRSRSELLCSNFSLGRFFFGFSAQSWTWKQFLCLFLRSVLSLYAMFNHVQTENKKLTKNKRSKKERCVLSSLLTFQKLWEIDEVLILGGMEICLVFIIEVSWCAFYHRSCDVKQRESF